MSTQRTAAVRLHEEGGIARLLLDRPPVNVLDLEGLGEMELLLDQVGAQEDVRVLCLTGAGRAFCSGVAVEDHLPERAEATVERFGRVVEELLDLPFPVVAGVHGAALGGGCELAAACDVVLARDDAVLGQPEIRLGVFPPAAAALLPRLLGRQRALDLLLTGRTLDAEEARAWGLVQRVFTAGAWEEELEAYLERLAGLSRPVLRLAKRATVRGLERPVREAMRDAERLYLEELMELRDPVEGLDAFLEKRPPVWEDR